MKLINATEHPIRIVHEDGTLITEIPPSGIVIRLLSSTVVPVDTFDGIPITKTYLRHLPICPRKKMECIILFLQMIKNAFPQREDLLVPTQMVRDENDTIVGAQSTWNLKGVWKRGVI